MIYNDKFFVSNKEFSLTKLVGSSYSEHMDVIDDYILCGISFRSANV